ncbi:hypothetical protein BTA35_0209375 [Oceanospirillum linum]|uniref:Uncharacterized protein n=2 Tax=Oceanospirillum linum TaxID=966 RepID=A0A1T1HBM6_OCELI|nr:hypothetical protein BTA35_0209375 [Oceanospirillum linum]SEF77508.1 hypothetical protein SAMN04489856_102274 [Oleiphilus messinensis]SMP17760.1 hypothetical protein SAMN06264348_103272 [Oceanospirillum linum]
MSSLLSINKAYLEAVLVNIFVFFFLLAPLQGKTDGMGCIVVQRYLTRGREGLYLCCQSLVNWFDQFDSVEDLSETCAWL